MLTLSDGGGVYLAASLPHGLQHGQAVLVLTAEEYTHRVLGKALRLRQVTSVLVDTHDNTESTRRDGAPSPKRLRTLV